MGTLVWDIYACATRPVCRNSGRSTEKRLGALRLDQQRAVLLRTIHRLRRLEEYACFLRRSRLHNSTPRAIDEDEDESTCGSEVSDAEFLRHIVLSYPYRHQMMDSDVDWAWMEQARFQGLTHLEARKRVREAVVSLGRLGEWIRGVMGEGEVKADDVFEEFVWSVLDEDGGTAEESEAMDDDGER